MPTVTPARSIPFPLHGKPKSKWLAYFMGMRAAVMDQWLEEQLGACPPATVLHLGCGLDARCERVGHSAAWYDVDMPDVISIRRNYYAESANYHMTGADVTDPAWLEDVPRAQNALVVMEGLSMYLPLEQLKELFTALQAHFDRALIIMDTYTQFAVRASKHANPIKAVGAGVITGIDDPHTLEQNPGIRVTGQLSLTPEAKIRELPGFDAWFFRLMFAGKATDGIYRLYTFQLENTAPGNRDGGIA